MRTFTKMAAVLLVAVTFTINAGDHGYEVKAGQNDRLMDLVGASDERYMMMVQIAKNPELRSEMIQRIMQSMSRDADMDMGLVMNDPEVSRRCRQVVTTNIAYEEALRAHTQLVGHVSITDFRDLDSPPNGNRFLVYSLFPDCTVNVKIIYDKNNLASIKVGHSILNRNCRVNVGKMLSAFEGGGHPGAGACRFAMEKAPEYLERIVGILQKNIPV